MEDHEFPSIPLLSAEDVEILMHRDAHFGGNFNIMIDYYGNQDHIGIMPDFEVERIKFLQQKEGEMGENLSTILMPLPAKQIVEKSKKLYISLRSVYEEAKEDLSKLISDLILAEEEEPVKEINALAEHKEKAVKLLLNLLSSEEFFDPLYPGYGRAPINAAKVLAKIKDERAIPYIFNAIGQDNFDADQEMITALLSFGEPAKNFLLKKMLGQPYSKDNERAMMALTALEGDEEIAKVALSLLEEKGVMAHEGFAIYLVLACYPLIHEHDRNRFKALSHLKAIPSSVRGEMEMVIKFWR